MASASSNSNTAATQPQSDTPQALKSWWNNFKKRSKKDTAPPGPPQPPPGAIFGIPLATSIRYANVAISLMQEDGSSYTYGYIPIIVAKCGVFLKDKATEIQGIFRLAGSARRMNQLQEIFNTPDKYGKGLDWDGYTVHDAANVLRRYLNQLPEPIVPLELYEAFRNPLKQHQHAAVGNQDAQGTDIGDFSFDDAITTYRTLITRLPPLNRQLLLYILDMLAIFAAKNGINHMTAANLAVIFQPGMLHHPDHDKEPGQYRLSQDVVIFLIDQQDNFLLGMPGTAADEKTRNLIESGPPQAAPATPTRNAAGLGRSVSTTSRSTNSSRLAGIRRNLSVSSRGSRASVIAAGPGTPGTPGAPGTPGVHRSNTVPSRKSPAVSQSRFSRPSDSPNATPPVATPDMTISSPPQSPAQVTAAAVVGSPVPLTELRTGSIAPSNVSAVRDQSKERLLSTDGAQGLGPSPVKPRNTFSNLLKSPPSDDGQGRSPNKLRKKRQPSTAEAQPSGHSSAASLSAVDPEPPRLPHVGTFSSGNESSRQVSDNSQSGFVPTDDLPTPRGDITPQPADHGLKTQPVAFPDAGDASADRYDTSTGNEFEGDAARAPEKEKKRRWRFSVSAKRNQEEKHLGAGHGSSLYLGGHSDADLSKASSSSWRHRSSTNVAEGSAIADSNPEALRQGSRDQAYTSEDRSPTTDTSGKGPISWFKRKIKEREEKEHDGERAKSPGRNSTGRGPSSQNLDIVANGENASRQLSSDLNSTTLSDLSKEHQPSTQIPTGPITNHAAAVPSSAIPATSVAVQPAQAGAQAPRITTDNPQALASGVIPTVPGKIEDYMNDSDREKLQTARAAAQLNPPAHSTVGSATAKATDISIDPAYTKATGISLGAEADTEPTTPKASEVNAGLAALTMSSAAKPSSEST